MMLTHGTNIPMNATTSSTRTLRCPAFQPNISAVSTAAPWSVPTCSKSSAPSPAGRMPRLPLHRSRFATLTRRSGQPTNQAPTTIVDPSNSSTTTAAAAPQDKFEITLRGSEALQTVRWGLVPQGQGQAVVVTEVAEGSPAEQLGVRRGQRLCALSDPMRYGTMWTLEDRPSLRFVVDTLKMRRGAPVDLLLEPLVGEADMDAIFGPATTAAGAASASAAASEAAGAASSVARNSSGSESDVDTFPDDAAASANSIDLLTGSSSDGEGQQTIGERMAARYAAQQRAVNQVQKRIDRRKAYMEIDEQRDDTGLLLGLAAAFLIPALVILVIAYFTGYLDRLYLTALTLR